MTLIPPYPKLTKDIARQELKKLTAKYKALSTEERECTDGKALKEEIQHLTKQVKANFEKKMRGSDNAKEIAIKPTTTKQPVFIEILGEKVVRPKQINCFRYESVPGADCKYIEVYGDPRVKPELSPEALLKAHKDSNVIVFLKRPPLSKTKCFVFMLDGQEVLHSRKMRLAMAQMLTKADPVEFMKLELGEGAPREQLEQDGKPTKAYLEQLKDTFLSHGGYESVVKDVTRYIHVLYENSISNDKN